MTFTDAQNAELAKPLNPAVVASRQQGGGQVSYIEAWHAINEANRIFGFDGWTRETVDLRQLGEPYQVQGKDTWRVNYSAKVRVTAGGIVREGCGFGQGIDRDVGQAHESALKEAETDAMKRALMTFGNPFGLALYDKTKANVQAPRVEYITDAQRDEITVMAQGAGVELIDICKAARIESLKELRADRFSTIINKLKATMQANAEKAREPA
jgi:DNA repair and recombination protein RAD52